MKRKSIYLIGLASILLSFKTFANSEPDKDKVLELCKNKVSEPDKDKVLELCKDKVLEPDEDKVRRLEYLKSLSFEDLLEVEIKLDEAFNVFDGLIKAQKVKVASGVTQKTSEAPAVTTVITAQDIEAMGARDLDEVLESVPGMHVSRYQSGYNPIYIMRGIYSMDNAEILILINDVPLKSLVTGGRSVVWAGMPIQNISRIEIIRGPGSALYGADAVSGVINIITKQVDEINGTEVGVRIGSYQTSDAWVQHGDKIGDVKIASSVQVFDSNGQKGIIQEDGQTFFDQRGGLKYSYAPGSVNLAKKGLDARVDANRVDANKDTWRLQAGYRTRRDVQSGVPLSLNPLDLWRDDSVDATLSYVNPRLFDDWSVNARVSFREDNADINETLYFKRLSPNGKLDNNDTKSIMRLSERQTNAEASAFYRGWTDHLWRIGTSYQYGRLMDVKYIANFGSDANGNFIPPGSDLVDLSGTKGSIFPTSSRINESFFIQDEWKFADNWAFTAGIRYDHYSDFRGSTNPRTALVWQIEPNLTAKLLYGHAFRAPSFRELYENIGTEHGTSTLKPEKMRTGELALDWKATNDLYFAVNLYRFSIRDKITFEAQEEIFTTQQPTEVTSSDIPPSTNSSTSRFNYVAKNNDRWDGKGIELETRWKMSNRSSLLFNYSYTNIHKQLGGQIENAPHHKFYLRSDWLVHKNLYLNQQWNWISRRYRNTEEGDTREPLKGYNTFDLTLRYKDIKDDRWGFAVGVRNLFNVDAREPASRDVPYDLPLEGRNWFLEGRYRFK
jgi:outer membrane receptor for ferrienterochelin and colicin